VESSRLSFLDVAERAAGLFLLAVTMPVTAVSALTLAALSGRSPLVAHLRVGKNDKPFWMLKLKTMWNQRDRSFAVANGAARGSRADEGVRPTFGWIEYVDAEPAKRGKRSCDPRVSSRFAAFCRRHSIDELPQLWHVFRGEMSLVGPRPLTRAELVRHYGVQKAELLSVTPGLNGLWQVYGRSAIRFPQRSAMDLEMVRTLDRKMYLTIVLRTFSALFSGKGAW
jgi:lipopolysaccharide/colanic/teichoic acid biosynthesis glycosyltransferase